VFLGLAAIIAIADQLSKAWIAANFEVGAPVNIGGDAARIVLIHNNGALFGMFRDQAIVFAFFSVVVIGMIVVFHARAGSVMLVSIALGLLLGGAVGNLIDRLRLGYVIDFVDLGLGAWRWYTFNVADAAISTSIVLLLILAVRPTAQGAPRG
jgi:signal peptidase II